MDHVVLEKSEDNCDDSVEFEDIVDSLGFGFFQVRLLAMTGRFSCQLDIVLTLRVSVVRRRD
jgi:hypothetical protein